MKIEELAYHKTPLGELILRRRRETLLQNKEVFEVKLGDEFLMSSLFTEGEKQLSNLGLAALEGKLETPAGEYQHLARRSQQIWQASRTLCLTASFIANLLGAA